MFVFTFSQAETMQGFAKFLRIFPFFRSHSRAASFPASFSKAALLNIASFRCLPEAPSFVETQEKYMLYLCRIFLG